MIVAAPASFAQDLEELRPLWTPHYDELALNKDKVPLDPDETFYLSAEDRETLLYVSARQAGELIGYFIGFVQRHPHYRSMVVLKMDVFFVKPEHRGRHCGMKLLKATMAEAKRRGVDNWFMGVKMHSPELAGLLKIMKFTPIETYHSLWIGD